MTESKYPCIVFSERLSTGIVVHFENGVSVFFPSAFLYEQRDAASNKTLRQDEKGDDPQESEATYYWKFLIDIIAPGKS